MSDKAESGARAASQEPDWEVLIPYPAAEDADFSATAARDLAGDYWRHLTAAMEEAGTFGPENRHQVQRLVLAYVRYDQATAEIARHGAVTKAPKTKVLMLSVWLTVAKHASDEATTLEAELGLTPRRRNGAAPARTKKRARRAADAFLSPGAAAGSGHPLGH